MPAWKVCTPHFGFCVKLQHNMNLNVAIDQHLMLPSFAAERYESLMCYMLDVYPAVNCGVIGLLSVAEAGWCQKVEKGILKQKKIDL